MTFKDGTRKRTENNMTDVAIQPAGNVEYKMNKIVPIYLVTLEVDKKTDEPRCRFIATKWEDRVADSSRFIGFFTDALPAQISSNYDEIIKTTDKANFVDIVFPHNRIVSVRSLIYRHK